MVSIPQDFVYLATFSHVPPLRDIRSLAIFWLKTWCKWHLLGLNFNVAVHGHLDYTTRPFISIVLDLAATLFSAETPEVFCEKIALM